jgi:RNA polymerase sigma-70 factor, ECF subfamily
MDRDARLDEAIRSFRLGREVDSSFRHIFEECYGHVVRFFRRKNLSKEESDELAQDVFLFVYTGLKDLRDEQLFRSWLFSIARNRFTNYLMHLHAQKRSSVEVAISSADPGDQPVPEIPSSSRDPLALVLEKEKLDRLHSVLDTLPDQMRRCVTLRVVEDCKYEEIAHRMGISVNTVKVHLHKAKNVLTDKLSPYFSSIET